MPSGSSHRLERREGLSRNVRPPPLLQTLNGKPRIDAPPTPRPVDEDFIAAPPMEDTESELSEPEPPAVGRSRASEMLRDERPEFKLTNALQPSHHKEPRLQAISKLTADSDSDEGPHQSRADIQRTPYFGTSRRGKEQAKAYGTSQESNQKQKSYGRPQGSNTTARGGKRSSPDIGSPSPISKRKKVTSKLEDEKEAKRLRRPKKTFSQKETQPLKQLPTKQVARKTEKKAANWKKGAHSPSPERTQPSFKSYDEDPFEQFASKTSPKRFDKHESALLSSPPGNSLKIFKKHLSLTPDASPRSAVKAEFKHPSGSLPEPLRRTGRAAPRLGELDSSPKLPFKKKRDSFTDFSDSEAEENGTIQQVEARCPMCNETVDNVLLNTFSKGARLHIRKQIQFCRLHKKKSAEDAWRTRGYPEIDWDGLSTRLTNHYTMLNDIINGGSSHYGTLLIDKVKEGKNRTLLKAEDSLTPGYYGPRGLRALSENVISHFSSVLRERAVDDRLISSRGYSSYVEAVLVPELAVKLICEDMEVETEEARNILEESRWIGDLLHEDIGDTVDQLSDNEMGGH